MASLSNLTQVSGLTVNSPPVYRFFGGLCVLALLVACMHFISALRSGARGQRLLSERRLTMRPPTWLLEVGARLVQHSTRSV